MAHSAAGEGGPGRFAAYAWLVLGYNLLVILWGAVVRATGSGAGCGEHWPFCQGRVFPHAQQIATLIEFAHRATSGIDVLLVVGLLVLAFRRYARGHAVRRYAAATGFFTLTEGLVGAALVLYGAVGTNVSAGRVAILSVHLINTFLLIASLTLTAWAADRRVSPVAPPAPGARSYLIYGAALLGLVVIGITGTIAALADVLFPARSLAEALRWDFSGTAAPILHLRIVHPMMAVVAGGYLLAVAGLARHVAGPAVRKLAGWLIGLVIFQFCLGAVNMLLLAPVPLQVLHLLAADLVWITLVLLSAEAYRGGAEAVASSLSPSPAPLPTA
jgi:heme A synthase